MLTAPPFTLMSTRVPVDSVYGRDAAGEKYTDLARRSEELEADLANLEKEGAKENELKAQARVDQRKGKLQAPRRAAGASEEHWRGGCSPPSATWSRPPSRPPSPSPGSSSLIEDLLGTVQIKEIGSGALR